MKRSVHHCFALILILLISSCELPEGPNIITIFDSPVFKPPNPTQVKSPGQAMAAIVSVFTEDLRIPFAGPVHLYLYKNSLSFALYGHGWRTLPVDIADVTAFAKDDTIHVNLDKTKGIPWGNLVWLLAHEYAHVVHWKLAGGHPRGSKWFSEGLAEWAAARVFHCLGWQNYEVTQHRAMREILHYRDALPELSSLRDDRVWQYVLSKPKGQIPTYRLAFIAVDRIVQEKGLSAAIRYVSSGNFDDSFRFQLSDFLNDFAKFLSSKQSSTQAAFRVSKPDWRVDDQWTYAEKRPGQTVTLVKQVAGQRTLRGELCFLLTVGNEVYLYTKNDLQMKAIMKDGRLISEMDPTGQLFSWPLDANKEWRDSFTRRDLEPNSSRKVDRLMFVAGIEEVTVPAGTFEAVKIEAYGFNNGQLLAEYWYSPKAKWFIRVRTYSRREGLIEEELLRFKVTNRVT